MTKNTSSIRRYIYVCIVFLALTLIIIGLILLVTSAKTIVTPISDDYVITPSKLNNETSNVVYTIKNGGVTEQKNGNWILYWDKTPVRTFIFDNEGTIWIGWRGKIIHLLPLSSSFIEFDFNKVYDISEIALDNSGAVWIGSPIFRYSEDRWESFDSTYSLPLSISPNKTVWATSDDYRVSDCIIHYTQEVWKHYCPITSSTRTTVLDLVEDSNNNLWVSLRDDNFSNMGVWVLNKETWKSVEELNNVHISPYQIANVPDGSLWFVSSKNINSMLNGYVKKYDGEKWLINFENTEIIFDIQIAPDGTLWAFATDETDNYILEFKEDGWKKVLIEKDLYDVFGMSVDIYSFDFDPSGKLCLATNLGLLCKIK